MAYFLGRDVDIAITTEHATQGVVCKEWASVSDLDNEHIAGALDFATGASTANYTYAVAEDKALLFAGPRALSTAAGCKHNGVIDADVTGISPLLALAWNNTPDNLTGLDVSLGVQDEDVAFIGQRNILKAEIKKENSITITRKKADRVWDGVYNDARFGIKESNTAAAPTATIRTPGVFNGLSAPDFVTCGYRVVVRFADAPSIADTLINQSGGVPSGDTSFTLDSTTGMVAGEFIELGGPDQEDTSDKHEIVKVGAVASSTSITGCTRAQKGTEAIAHADNAKVKVVGSGAGEVLVFRNCYITEHSVTLAVDGSQEESLTLMTYIDPKIYDGIASAEWDDATAIGEL